jgi:hypothetical protein
VGGFATVVLLGSVGWVLWKKWMRRGAQQSWSHEHISQGQARIDPFVAPPPQAGLDVSESLPQMSQTISSSSVPHPNLKGHDHAASSGSGLSTQPRESLLQAPGPTIVRHQDSGVRISEWDEMDGPDVIDVPPDYVP